MLTDLVNDLDMGKTLVVGTYGSITGILASALDFDKRVEKKKHKLFKTNKNIEKEGLKGLISFIGGFNAADLSSGTKTSNCGEIITYTLTFRAGYSLGHYICDKYFK